MLNWISAPGFIKMGLDKVEMIVWLGGLQQVKSPDINMCVLYLVHLIDSREYNKTVQNWFGKTYMLISPIL